MQEKKRHYSFVFNMFKYDACLTKHGNDHIVVTLIEVTHE